MSEPSEWAPERLKRTDSIECQVIYSAKLIWCWEHSKKMIGKTYFVIARGSGTHVDMYKKEDLKGILACYPVHWFESFEAVAQPKEIESMETAADPVIEEVIFDQPEELQFFEQMKIF
ncbi:hypothetical protein [Domibacillus tundrae]|uniref:hypothetical protein n=1 Tax=Domibacillus tundrae TaxID=1587527 RepID=UPI00339769F7